MLRTTFITAVVLILAGVGFYLGSGMQSVTALIPAFVGGGVGLFGLLGLIESPRWVRPAVMHLAMVFALLLGVASAAMGVPGLVELIRTGEHDRPLAPVLQSVMAVVLLAYLGAGVRGFLRARRAASTDAPNDAPETQGGA